VPLITWPQRCSRPLCSSQATGGRTPWSPRSSASGGRSTKREPTCGEPAQGWLWPRSEGADQPAPSGPNSVPRSTYGLTRRSNRSCWSYWSANAGRRPTGQCSTHELRSGMHIRTRVWTPDLRTPGAP